MVFALVGALVVLELWRGDLRIPFEYTGDATLNLTIVKTVLEHGWYVHNSDLGAPHGQALYDYPVVSAETLNLLLIRILGLVTDNAALVMNLFFLLTFPLVALTAYIALRRLPVSHGVAFVCALLYALLPYHFLRGEVHLFLAAYYAVPLGAYLAIAVFRGERLFGRWRPTLVTAAFCTVVATASGSFYYAVFTVLLVVAAAALRFVTERDRAALAAGGSVVAIIVGLSVVQLAPTIAYRLRHGPNDEVAKRYWFESENYSLKITNLVLPVDQHRIGAIAHLKDEYNQQIPQTEARMATLGLVGTIGFLWLLAVAVAACAGAGRRYRLGLYSGLAALTVVALLVGTTGSFSTLIAVVWPQIRSWNRLSVFIAFFSLAAVALLLDGLRGMLERRRLPAPVFPAVLVVVLAVGVLDQTTPAYVPAYDAIASAYRADGAFVDSLEQELPAGASVLQLPYEPFPEPALSGRELYDPAKGYLHSSDLRWSWGAVRGRPDDWVATIADKPAPEVVAAARQEGFAGILLDRFAYGPAAAAKEAEFRAAAGGPPTASPDGRYIFLPI